MFVSPVPSPDPPASTNLQSQESQEEFDSLFNSVAEEQVPSPKEEVPPPLSDNDLAVFDPCFKQGKNKCVCLKIPSHYHIDNVKTLVIYCNNMLCSHLFITSPKSKSKSTYRHNTLGICSRERKHPNQSFNNFTAPGPFYKVYIKSD